MSYSSRNISPLRQIREGLSDREADISSREEMPDMSATINDRSIRVRDIVMGVNPDYGTRMSPSEWEKMLDAIQATPDQRLVYEETQRIQRAAESSNGLTSSDLFSEEGDPDRYVEQE